MSAFSLEIELASLRDASKEKVGRLETGFSTINKAKQKGKNVDQWEDHWIALLREYEATEREIKKLQEKIKLLQAKSSGGEQDNGKPVGKPVTNARGTDRTDNDDGLPDYF